MLYNLLKKQLVYPSFVREAFIRPGLSRMSISHEAVELKVELKNYMYKIYLNEKVLFSIQDEEYEIENFNNNIFTKILLALKWSERDLNTKWSDVSIAYVTHKLIDMFRILTNYKSLFRPYEIELDLINDESVLFTSSRQDDLNSPVEYIRLFKRLNKEENITEHKFYPKSITIADLNNLVNRQGGDYGNFFL